MGRPHRSVQRVMALVIVLALAAAGAGVLVWQQKNRARLQLAESLYRSGISKLAQNEYGDAAAYLAAALRGGSHQARGLAQSMIALRDDRVLLPGVALEQAAFSPDGRYLAAFASQGGQAAVLQVWDARGRRKLADVPGAQLQPGHPPLFDRQSRIYVSNQRQQVLRYHPATGQLAVLYPGDEAQTVALLGVSGDGQWLVLRPDGAAELVLQHTADAGVRLQVPVPPRARPVFGFSADGRQVVVLANEPGQSRGSWLALPAPGQAAESPDRAARRALQLPVPIESARFSPDGGRVLLVGEGQAFLLDAGSGRRPLRLHSRQDRVQGLAFNPGGATLVAVGATGYDVLDAATGALQASHDWPLGTLADVWDAPRLAGQGRSPDLSQRICTMNGQSCLQNVGTEHLRLAERRFEPQWRQVLALADGRHLLALASDGRTLARIDTATGREQPAFIRLPEETADVRELNAGLLMTVSSANRLYFFHPGSGEPIGFPLRAGPQARDFRSNRDQSLILARTGDNSFVIWRVKDGLEVLRWQEPHSLGHFMLDDGFRWILITDDAGWSLKTVEGKACVLSGAERLGNAAFSPDGRWLALAGLAGRIQVYDLENPGQPFELPGIASPALRFSPDGQLLLASEDRRHLRLWRTRDGQSVGQPVPVAPDTGLLAFSADGSRLFLQDDQAGQLAPAVRIIDTATGQPLSLPFAAGHYSSIRLLQQAQRIATIERLPEGERLRLWQLPDSPKLPPVQLAAELEAFYGRCHDPQTGTVHACEGEPRFSSWYFQDIYTRTTAPDSGITVVEAIERLLPLHDRAGVERLVSLYFYHPLARAGLAAFFAGQPDAGALAARLVALTELQLPLIADEGLKQKIRQRLQPARAVLPAAGGLAADLAADRGPEAAADRHRLPALPAGPYLRSLNKGEQDGIARAGA